MTWLIILMFPNLSPSTLFIRIFKVLHKRKRELKNKQLLYIVNGSKFYLLMGGFHLILMLTIREYSSLAYRVVRIGKMSMIKESLCIKKQSKTKIKKHFLKDIYGLHWPLLFLFRFSKSSAAPCCCKFQEKKNPFITQLILYIFFLPFLLGWGSRGYFLPKWNFDSSEGIRLMQNLVGGNYSFETLAH